MKLLHFFLCCKLIGLSLWIPHAHSNEVNLSFVMNHARETACKLDIGELNITDDEGDAADKELVIRLGRWIKSYNVFADSLEAKFLRQYADLVYELSPFEKSYSAESCLILKPILGIALTADVLRSKGGDISSGALLDPIKDEPLPKAIRVLVRKCTYQPLLNPIQPMC